MLLPCKDRSMHDHQSSSRHLADVAIWQISPALLKMMEMKCCLARTWSWLRYGCACAGYVVLLWYAAGYLNTCAYVVGPNIVAPAHKAMANALLALASQVAHCAGLFAAVVLAFVLYGDVVG